MGSGVKKFSLEAVRAVQVRYAEGSDYPVREVRGSQVQVIIVGTG